ncbi:MAG: alpha-L-fucosidase [bacterium]
MAAYQPQWTSLAEHPVPSWFRGAKLGIYTHWGPYCVPSYGGNGTWYPHQMYIDGTPEHRHHVKTYGHPSKFGYKDFIPMFTGAKFDPEEWADLFRRAGARFAGPVAEHHDGFSMWDSRVNRWNSARMGPKRNIVGELEKTIRAAGMKFLTTFHHGANWIFFPTSDPRYDCMTPESADLYTRPHAPDAPPDTAFHELWLAKLREVWDDCQPDIIWFDFDLGLMRDRWRRRAIADYYNRAETWGREVVATAKEMPKGWFNLPPHAGVLDLEVGRMNEMTQHLWLTDTSIDAGPGGAWSHVRNIGYKSVERLVHTTADIASKNGCLLLNAGPRADGTIPEAAREALLGLGRWLERNGEAIHDTTPWITSGEGPTRQEGGGHFNEDNEPRLTAHDIRFTTKGDNVYAICMGRPGDQTLIRSFRLPTKEAARTMQPVDSSEIRAIHCLGCEQPLRWRIDEDGLMIENPEKLPGEHAFVYRIGLIPADHEENGEHGQARTNTDEHGDHGEARGGGAARAG